jgi:hypothetical protein
MAFEDVSPAAKLAYVSNETKGTTTSKQPPRTRVLPKNTDITTYFQYGSHVFSMTVLPDKRIMLCIEYVWDDGELMNFGFQYSDGISRKGLNPLHIIRIFNHEVEKPVILRHIRMYMNAHYPSVGSCSPESKSVLKKDMEPVTEVTKDVATASVQQADVPDEVCVSAPKIRLDQQMEWHIKRFFRHIKETIEFFRLQRMFKKYPTISVSTRITNLNNPEMYVPVREIVMLIKKFKIDPTTLSNQDGYGRGTACIGFSPKHQKWYGWSHRAIYGFKVGDVVEEGDITTSTKWIEEFEVTHPEIAFKHVLKPGFEAKTLEDAKKMAIAFAAAVS